MIVTGLNINQVIADLACHELLSLDTETTGLRPYKGDRPFSIIIGTNKNAYYFDVVELGTILERLTLIFNKENITWFFLNAPFDLAHLARLGFAISGNIWDTGVQERVLYNEAPPGGFSLENLALKYGFKKDGAVDEYVKKHGLSSKVNIPGKKEPYTIKHFNLVPPSILIPYALNDARITFDIGIKQVHALKSAAETIPEGVPNIAEVFKNEMMLSKVCFEMEKIGVQIDREFVKRAIDYEQEKQSELLGFFKDFTGEDYSASPLLFRRLLEGDKDRWEYTEKGNPSFTSDVLEHFETPIAKTIIAIRGCKSKLDFFTGFEWHMDPNGAVHPHWNQNFTRTGRFSSSGPNFQNLEKSGDEDASQGQSSVRRAIVPRPGFILIAPDYDQIEYRLMMEYACRNVGKITPIVEKVLGGLDVHSAMAEIVFGEVTPTTRGRSKTINFGTLYGQGIRALAKSLRVDLHTARKIQDKVFKEAPEIAALIDKVIATAEQRKVIVSWAGRQHHYPIKSFCYKAPNGLIQGGAADVMKFFMVRAADKIREENWKSRLIMSVHDEAVFEVHESEISFFPQWVAETMETVFPHRYLPLTVGMKWSAESLADMKKGMP